MKKAQIPTLCACALLLTRVSCAQEAAPAQAPTLDWRLHFEAGQTVRVRREVYSSGEVNFGGHKIEMKNSLALSYGLQVLEVEPDGTARARLKLLTFGFKGDGGRTFYSPYSSMTTDVDAVLRPYRLAAESSLEVSIEPRGEMNWKGENFEEHRNEKRYQAKMRRGPNALDEIAAELTLYNLAEELRLLLSHLPQEPVQGGQKWSRSVRNHPTLSEQTIELGGALSSITGTRAMLTSNTKWLPRPRHTDDEVWEAPTTRLGSGHIDLDIASGWPVRAEEDIRASQSREPAQDAPEDAPTATNKQRIIITFTLGEPTK